MRADLDLLCISVYCTADDLLPERPGNARRKLTDAEIVTLCVAQVLMGIPSDRRFLRAARRQLGHLFPAAAQPGRAAQAARAAGRDDRVADRRLRRAEPRRQRRSRAARLDPGRVRPLARDRPPLAAGRGLRLRLLARATPAGSGGCDCTWSAPPTARRARPRSSPPTVPNARSRCHCSPRALRGGETIVCDKGYAGREFAAAVAALGAHHRPPRPQRRAADHGSISRRSGSGSNRSSAPAKTCSPSNATAPAPHATSAPASQPACSRSPPASASTTNSAAPAAPSPTTPPNPWHQSSSALHPDECPTADGR